ncbi:HTH cro/C1-type domain-containing protein [Vibrio crassostreae]|uniref:Helix-turn-helix domain-containing protein n=2 Tax=Vibrio TaxID=662 RepID=A0AA43FU92_VIBSP|nr:MULTISPECIES: helix-turn-helix transcriptional regulator [Vibrio]MDH5919797.1 helix-turn-helix domain-containing protein [Vibrio splendidus]MDH5936543.1 helix-turn-helix domain-containing protein [Vibrio splendidus]MDH5951305.1 helix-turn-helix domain-containing protein [Vibrio crassostreae]TCN05602.1 Cro/C1-type helix-turn-helix DNA-binding protein [Vibrio crassostreae]TCU02393.1 Cro/C1-type helix-turn-helix DNA-binding protein [Vibrio crassostreae]
MSSIENVTIETKIIDLLEKTSISKSEIARLCGVTRGSVQHWARSGNVSKNNLVKLCEVLDQDIKTLFDTSITTKTLRPFQEKAINIIKNLPDAEYYKLEEVISILEKK